MKKSTLEQMVENSGQEIVIEEINRLVEEIRFFSNVDSDGDTFFCQEYDLDETLDTIKQLTKKL